jgi:hypothetical protein
MKRRFVILILLLTTTSLLAYAHEGMIHVIGTVTAFTEKSITVTTTDKQNVGVVLTAATTYEKGTAPAAWKDLKTGDRVVIHAVKVNDVLQAHDVRFSEVTVRSPQ